MNKEVFLLNFCWASFYCTESFFFYNKTSQTLPRCLEYCVHSSLAYLNLFLNVSLETIDQVSLLFVSNVLLPRDEVI